MEETTMAEQLIPWLLLLQKYYEGQLTHLSAEQWGEITQSLREEPLAGEKGFSEGLSQLCAAEPSAQRDLQYEFNRLFVGPNELAAPPYESCYTDDDRTLMQNQTLRVRQCYLEAGLQVAQKNIEPDDFLGFELEFLLFLLSDTEQEREQQIAHFAVHHLQNWIGAHAEDIKKTAQNPICRGMAEILLGVLAILKQVYPAQAEA